MITDHAHQPQRIGSGRFVGPKCGVCGERNAAHLSYGQQIAERIGGNAIDYVERPS